MDSSRRAVESYWRSRLVDAVTSDEDKVAPVYKLDEICELLRVSDSGIVKEVSEFVLKRLDHKSPVVKQKALRLIKYAIPKSGPEFRREIQKNSTSMRQLAHYKGQPDPLKGDALNRAVRETANEAVAVVFSTGEQQKPVEKSKEKANEGLGKRIQGFGNTNYDPTMMRDDKRSFLTDVVEMGSASLKQGLSTLSAAHNMMKSEGYNSGTGSGTGTGTYRSPALRRSLTSEKNSESYGDNASWQGGLKNGGGSGNKWGDSGTGTSVSTSGTGDETGTGTGTGKAGVKTREERLLETVVTTGGVRLQPTRDALQLFITETAKLDALSMSHAIETKLQSPIWQVRMKAMCVLEAILRKKEEEPYFVIYSYFYENCDSVARCCDLPQVSLREKATKVLHMLDGDQTTETTRVSEPTQSKSSPMELPDLIDTGNFMDEQIQSETPTNIINTNNNIDDLLGGVADISTSSVADISADFSNTPNSKASNGNDPFADVSFHVSEERESTKDLFSGLTTINDDNNDDSKNVLPDIFADISPKITESQSSGLNDLMAGLDITGTVPAQQNDTTSGLNIATGTVPAQNDLNSLYNQVPVQFNAIPPQFMINPAILGQQQMNMNYGAMNALIAQQQQILQNMGGFNNAGFGNNSNNVSFGGNSNMGFGGFEGGIGTGFNSPAFPDIFQTSGSNNNSNQVQNHTMMGSSKKEDNTKAFDFVSDHLAAARGPKKLI